MKNFLVPAVAACLCAMSMAVSAKDEAMASALKDRTGKVTTIVLQSGTEISGKVASVGNNTVKLSELSGKDFFDAVIDLDDISAVVYRARAN